MTRALLLVLTVGLPACFKDADRLAPTRAKEFAEAMLGKDARVSCWFVGQLADSARCTILNGDRLYPIICGPDWCALVSQ